MADDAQPARLERRARLPGRQQVLEHREEPLLGRIPRLQQVVVERDLVDRRDRRSRVGVGGQQHALGVGDDRAGLHQEVRAGHHRHALVGEQQGDLVAARAQLREDLERLGARARAQDPVALAEAAPQVARDRRQHDGLVVDGDDRGPPLARGRRRRGRLFFTRKCPCHGLHPIDLQAPGLGSYDGSWYSFGSKQRTTGRNVHQQWPTTFIRTGWLE